MSNNANITIRRLNPSGDDTSQLIRLAGLDSRSTPAGDLLGAEVDGQLLAAISLDDGTVIADPFAPTSELRKLLKLRADQLRSDGRHHSRRLRLRGDRPARASVAL